MTQSLRRGILALLALAAAALPASAQRIGKNEVEPPPAATAIDIKAQPIPSFDHRESDRRRFGRLDWRGGLVLTSNFREFGGLSALSVAADGASLLAANDRGWWLRGRIAYSGTRPTGLVDAEMAPMLGPDGRTLAARRWYDTESIARDGNTVYVGIERVHRIVRFDIGKDGLAARARPIDVPAAFRSLPSNGSIEALAFVPRGGTLGGTLVAIAERGRDRAGNHLAFLIGGPRPGAFTIVRKNDYDVSDAAALPSGDLLVLERKFGWATGLYIRIRRIAIADIRPGAVADGAILLEADLGQQIDNLEGLAVHTSGGDTVLTLISDDNFSMLQRTMLLQFTLAPE
ncbi:MAG: esterase-like activity of phytase family protein [Hyphomicrobiales bacterium]|nr:esterase-like activity of phytase family protein [Hyphomicrobiales bacterium]